MRKGTIIVHKRNTNTIPYVITILYVQIPINIFNYCLLIYYRTIDIDTLLEEVGEFGRYQKRYVFLLGLALLFTASSTLSFVFTTADMNYR